MRVATSLHQSRLRRGEVAGDYRLPHLCTERLPFENGPRAHGKSHAERHFLSSRTRKYFCACARKVLQSAAIKAALVDGPKRASRAAGSVAASRNVITHQAS